MWSLCAAGGQSPFSAAACWVTRTCGLKNMNPGRRIPEHCPVKVEGASPLPTVALSKVPKSLPFPGHQSGEATYLGRQAVADGVHVVGGRRRVHEAVRVAGEAVAGSVGRAGVGGCGGRGQPPLVHGGRRERLRPVHGAAPICGETQKTA